MTQVHSYPLHWPPGFPRSPRREGSRIKVDLDTSLGNVKKSLQLFAHDSCKPITDPVLSSNMNVLLDRKPIDPGVAIWFSWADLSVCIPVDRYDSVSAN